MTEPEYGLRRYQCNTKAVNNFVWLHSKVMRLEQVCNHETFTTVFGKPPWHELIYILEQHGLDRYHTWNRWRDWNSLPIWNRSYIFELVYAVYDKFALLRTLPNNSVFYMTVFYLSFFSLTTRYRIYVNTTCICKHNSLSERISITTF